jgi:opacity protein-like surface antigen
MVADGGIGAAMESHVLNREVYFAFAEAEANYSKAYEERHRVGGGATVGMLADVTDRWKLMLSGSYRRYPFGDKSDDIRWYAGSRFTLAQNWAMRLDYNHRDRDNDVAVSLQAFF